MSTKKKFIYCLDTFWGEDFSEKAQVLSILKFLQEIHDIEFFYWRCATYEEFKYHLQNTIDFIQNKRNKRTRGLNLAA